MLYDEQGISCGTLDRNGSFYLTAFNIDPDTNGTEPDIFVRIIPDNDVVSVADINNYYIFDSNVYENHNNTILVMGNIALNIQHETTQVFGVFKWVNQVHEFIYNTTDIDLSKVLVTVTDFYGAGYALNNIYYGYDLIHPRVTFHEYGHHLFNSYLYPQILGNTEHSLFQPFFRDGCSVYIEPGTVGCAYPEGFAEGIAYMLSNDDQSYSYTTRVFNENRTLLKDGILQPYPNGSDVPINFAALMNDIHDPMGENGSDDIENKFKELLNMMKDYQPYSHPDLVRIWNGEIPYGPDVPPGPSLANLTKLNTIEYTNPVHLEEHEELILYERMNDPSNWTSSGGGVWRNLSSYVWINQFDCQVICNLTRSVPLNLSGYEDITMGFGYVQTTDTSEFSVQTSNNGSVWNTVSMPYKAIWDRRIDAISLNAHENFTVRLVFKPDSNMFQSNRATSIAFTELVIKGTPTTAVPATSDHTSNNTNLIQTVGKVCQSRIYNTNISNGNADKFYGGQHIGHDLHVYTNNMRDPSMY